MRGHYGRWLRQGGPGAIELAGRQLTVEVKPREDLPRWSRLSSSCECAKKVVGSELTDRGVKQEMKGNEKSSPFSAASFNTQKSKEIIRITRLRIGLVLLLLVTFCLIATGAQPFENEAFSFTVPGKWKTIEEVWNRSASPGREYCGLGVREIVTFQYPAIPGKGEAFFTVAHSRLRKGEDLKSRMKRSYEKAIPKIKGERINSFQMGGLWAYEIVYHRPWDENWWKFRDIWVEKDGMVYVLSFHALPNSFDTYQEVLYQILESFRFKE